MKLEDLAVIGDFIRFRANTNELSTRYMQAIKPVVIKNWESGAFQTEESAILIATKLIISTSQVFKYNGSEPELWNTLIEMLKWALKAQDGESNLIPMP